MSLSRPALIFIILLLVLGALVLSSTGLDPQAVARAQFTLTPSMTYTPSITPTPIDPFAELSYVPWTSPDGLISLEHPKLWVAQPFPQNGPAGYIFTVPGVSDAVMGVAGVPVSQLQLTNVPANATAADYLRLLLPDLPAERIVSATVAGLNGAHVKQTLTRQDPATGQNTVNTDVDSYLLALDSANVLLIQGSAPTADWAKMQSVLDHALATLKLNPQGLVALLNRAANPPSAATATATVAPTVQPTAEATSEVTAEATTEATTATPLPTTQPQVAPTSEATAEPISAATAATSGGSSGLVTATPLPTTRP